MFVDFDICHRTASLRKLYSLTLTYIFVFKCFKYVNNLFVFVCCQLDKIMKKISSTHSDICDRTALSPILSSVTFTYIFDFKCLKCVKFERFLVLPDDYNYEIIIQRYTFHHFQSNAISPTFSSVTLTCILDFLNV